MLACSCYVACVLPFSTSYFFLSELLNSPCLENRSRLLLLLLHYVLVVGVATFYSHSLIHSFGFGAGWCLDVGL